MMSRWHWVVFVFNLVGILSFVLGENVDIGGAGGGGTALAIVDGVVVSEEAVFDASVSAFTLEVYVIAHRPGKIVSFNGKEDLGWQVLEVWLDNWFNLYVSLNGDVSVYNQAETGVVRDQWFHVAISSGENMMMKMYVNGKRQAGINTISYYRQDALVKPRSSIKPGEGCQSFGGYNEEGTVTPCALPFSFKGKNYDRCVPFEESIDGVSVVRPWVGSNDDFPTLTETWCSQVNRYNTKANVRKSWGFCDCPAFENSTYIGKQGLLVENGLSNRTKIPSMTVLSSSNASRVFDVPERMNLVSIPGDMLSDLSQVMDHVRRKSFSKPSETALLVVLPNNRTYPPLYEELLPLSNDLDIPVVIVVRENAINGSLQRTGLYDTELVSCFELGKVGETVVNPRHRCYAARNVSKFSRVGYEGSGSDGIIRPIAGDSCILSTFPNPAFPFDGRVDTTYSVSASTSMEIAYLFDVPVVARHFATHYALVGFNKTRTVSWKFQVLLETGSVLKEWVDVDERKDVADVFSSSSVVQVGWFPLNLTKLGNFKEGSEIKGFRVKFGQSFELAEFGIFDIGDETMETSSSLFQNGPVQPSSWYATTNTTTNRFHNIVAFGQRYEDFVNQKGNVTSYIVTSFDNDLTITTPMFQKDGGTFRFGGNGFVGMVDEFRVFNKERSMDEIQSTLPYASLSDGAIVFSRTFESGNGTLIASRAPLVNSEMVVQVEIDRSQDLLIDLYGVLVDSRSRFSLGERPDFGDLDLIGWNDKNSETISVGEYSQIGTVRYKLTRKGQQNLIKMMEEAGQASDSFTYAISPPRGKKVEGKVEIRFKPLQLSETRPVKGAYDRFSLAQFSPNTNKPMKIRFDALPKGVELFMLLLNRNGEERCERIVTNRLYDHESVIYFQTKTTRRDNYTLKFAYEDFLEIPYTGTLVAQSAAAWTSLPAIGDVRFRANVTVDLNVSSCEQDIMFNMTNPDHQLQILVPPLFGKLYSKRNGVPLTLPTGTSSNTVVVGSTVSQYVQKVIQTSSQVASCSVCFEPNAVCSISECGRDNGDYFSSSLVGSPDGKMWKPMGSRFEYLEFDLADAVYVSEVQFFPSLETFRLNVENGQAGRVSISVRRQQNGTTAWVPLRSCVSTVKANSIRVEFVNFGDFMIDAIRVTGSLDPRPGLIDPNDVLFVRDAGIEYVKDTFDFVVTDCAATSNSSRVYISAKGFPETNRTTQKKNNTNASTSPSGAHMKLQALVPRVGLVQEVDRFELDYSAVTNNLLNRIKKRNEEIRPNRISSQVIVPSGNWSSSPIPVAHGEQYISTIELPFAINISTNVVLPMKVIFSNLLEQPITYNIDVEVYLDCFGNDQYGQCSKRRPFLPGVCNFQSGTCKCDTWKVEGSPAAGDGSGENGNEIDDALIKAFSAGDSCQYTMWETCKGRGVPFMDPVSGDFLRCQCFNDTKFGGKFCETRDGPIINGVEELLNEVAVVQDLLGKVFPSRVFSIEERNETDEYYAVLVEQIASSSSTTGRLLTSDTIDVVRYGLKSESSFSGTCYHHGRPTLDSGECICNGFYEPPTCISQASCPFGYYIELVDNPEWDPTLNIENNESIPRLIGQCVLCPVGFYCDSQRKLTCRNGTFAHEMGLGQCRDTCEDKGAHMVYNPDAINNIECVLCAKGHFCDGQRQYECPLGAFTPDEGNTKCIRCEQVSSLAYSDVVPGFNCSFCPPNTMRTGPGESVEECMCKPGFWNNRPTETNRTGIPCVSCPEGAVCRGSTYVVDGAAPPYYNLNPHPAEGYWGDQSYPSKFFDCEDVCIGTEEFQCLEGNNNTMCYQCEDGWYRMGDCRQCPGSSPFANALFVLVVSSLIVICWVILNKASNEVKTLDIGLLFTQSVAIVQSYDFVWPFPVYILNTPLEITGFEVDFFEPSCMIYWNYRRHYWLQYALPIIYAAVQGVLILLGRAKVRYYEKKRRERGQGNPADDGEHVGSGKRLDERAAQSNGGKDAEASEGEQVVSNNCLDRMVIALKSFWNWMRVLPRTEAELKSFRNKQIELIINFLLIVYPALVIILLQPFICIELADGTLVMEAAPDIVCWEGEHLWSLLVWSVIGCLIYIIGIPAFTFYILYEAHFHNKKMNATFATRHGWLWNDFHQDKFYWESLLLFRRFCLSSILVLGQGFPYIQAITSGIIVVILFTLQLIKKPFVNTKINVLDQLSLLCTFLYIFFGVVFTGYYDGGSSDAEGIIAFLSWALFFFTLAVIGMAFWFFYLDSREYVLVFASERHLAQVARGENFALVSAIVSGPSMLDTVVTDVEGKVDDYLSLRYDKDNDGENAHSIKEDDGEDVEEQEQQEVRQNGDADYYKDGVNTSEVDIVDLEGKPGEKVQSQIETTTTKEEEEEEEQATPDQGKTKLGSGKNLLRNSRKHLKSFLQISLHGRMSRMSRRLALQGMSKQIALFELLDKDKDGFISESEIKMYLRERFGMEETTYEPQIHQLCMQYGDKDGKLTEETFIDIILSSTWDIRASRLKYALRASFLINWVDSGTTTPLQTCLFFEVDRSVRGLLKNDSIVSPFQSTRLAKMYRKLDKSLPMLLDVLAVCDQEDVQAMARIIDKLLQAETAIRSNPSSLRRRGSRWDKGLLSNMLVPQARAPFLYWVLNQATEPQRRAFKSLFFSIMRSNESTVVFYNHHHHHHNNNTRSNTTNDA